MRLFSQGLQSSILHLQSFVLEVQSSGLVPHGDILDNYGSPQHVGSLKSCSINLLQQADLLVCFCQGKICVLKRAWRALVDLFRVGGYGW
jgi:hypothetical protein